LTETFAPSDTFNISRWSLSTSYCCLAISAPSLLRRCVFNINFFWRPFSFPRAHMSGASDRANVAKLLPVPNTRDAMAGGRRHSQPVAQTFRPPRSLGHVFHIDCGTGQCQRTALRCQSRAAMPEAALTSINAAIAICCSDCHLIDPRRISQYSAANRWFVSLRATRRSRR
jgi:hypothetical protein